MQVSIIIVNYNVRHFLELCLHSVGRAIRAFREDAVEVFVVDNRSTDDSLAMLAANFPAVQVIANEENVGFGRANNQAVARAQGKYILFLNPDTVMPEDFLVKTVGYLEAHPQAGALGPRLIDGHGAFAPDSKKSFPTLWVALTKTLGLGKLFPRSPLFNSYYAVHIPEHHTSEVEVLSGCCMLVRRTALAVAGNGFDEDYFMYCEDVDLCWRLREAGWQNIYFPGATLIHYKGESTRKATVSYIRIFNEALSTFVRKHYSAGRARSFVLLLQVGIFGRAVMGLARNIFRVLRLPLFDALVLFATLFLMKGFWVDQVKNISPLPAGSILATFPAYVLLWILSLYLNGAYDQPYRPLRVLRGMLIGSVAILAYFGLLPAHLRYSRALILLSGITGAVVLLGLHELLSRLGIFRFIRRDETNTVAVVAGSAPAFEQALSALRLKSGAPVVLGRVALANENDAEALGAIPELPSIARAGSVNEIIFCVDGLDYARTLQLMQACGPAYEYKIFLPDSQTFVGATGGDKFHMAGRRYRLAHFSQQRNKRLVDILMAVLLLLAAPVLLFAVKKPGGLLPHIFQVLSGKKTWVGYENSWEQLPRSKPYVLPVYNLTPGYAAGTALQYQAAEHYARWYVPGRDLVQIVRNWKFLGGI